MGLSSKIGSFNTGTGTAGTTITINDVGFQPSVILFWWNGRSESSDTSGRANYRSGFGACTSTSNRAAMTSASVDAAASIDGGRYYRTDECVIVPVTTGSSGTEGQLDVTEFNSSGFVMTVDQQFTSNLRVIYLALGGSDITNATVGTFTGTATAGNFDITTVGFQPDLLFTCSSSASAAAPTGSVNRSLFGFGVATGASEQFVLAYGAGPEGTATIQSRSYFRGGECYCTLRDDVTLGIISRGGLVSFLSNGFTLSSSSSYANVYLYVAVQASGCFKVGTFDSRTDTNDITVSSLGFTPGGGILVSHGLTESSAGTQQNHAKFSYGLFKSTTDRVSIGGIDVDNVADSQVSTGIEYDEAYINFATDGTIDGLLDVKSMDSGGFTFVMDNAETSASKIGYLAFKTDAVTSAKVYLGSDVIDGNWTNESGNNTNLYDSVNEASASDSDYIQSEYGPSNSYVVLKFNSVADPVSSSNHVLSYRIQKVPVSGVDINMVVELRQGYVNEASKGTLIATWTQSGVSPTLTTVQQTLTAGEADSITDYSNLYLRLVAGV